jgi:hypothetical protein
MLKFEVFENAGPAKSWPLRSAYLVGADGNPIRGTLEFEGGAIVADKREAGSAALVLLHPCGDLGELVLQTCLLPERDEPYLLNLELARHRLMTLYSKLEDWSMFELPADHPVLKRLEEARQLFVESLCLRNHDPVKSDELASKCLEAAIDGTEELALAHSDLLLNRRRETRAVPKLAIGSGIAPSMSDERVRMGLSSNFDFVLVPAPWKMLCPTENTYDWSVLDSWAEWAGRAKVPLSLGPLLCFAPDQMPDWVYIWEHDYDTIRDVAYEHIERVLERYRDRVSSWNILAGVHVNQHFPFNFEQIMDLTRMSAMLVKKMHPQGRSSIEVRQPFGEYFASNARSIPPHIYADLIVQGGVPFDALSIRMPTGQSLPGQFTRDLMQMSMMLEQFGVFGKPIRLIVSAPSQPVSSMMIADPSNEEPVDDRCGHWRRPWSPNVQSHWLEAVYQVAMSKPFVEAVIWDDLIDHSNIVLPMGGLVAEDFQIKPAFRRLVSFRQSLRVEPSAGSTADPAPPAGSAASTVTAVPEPTVRNDDPER